MTNGASTVACPRCGALNELEFGECIRCGAPLKGDEAEPAEKAQRRVPAPRSQGQGAAGGPIALGPGAEPFLGRFEATTFPGAKLVFAINLAIFAVQVGHAIGRWGFSALIFGGAPGEALLYGAFVPADAAHVLAEPWRLISANWVHFGIIHFGFNMLAVAQLSRIMEPAIGTYRYLIAYVLTGVFGFVTSTVAETVLANPEGPIPITAGASASLFGVLGLILGFLWRRGDPRWKQFAGQTVFYALIFGFVIRANNAAHIGGLLAGIPFGILFAPGAPKPSRPWQRAAAILCIVASLGSLVAARTSPLYQVTLDALEEAALDKR